MIVRREVLDDGRCWLEMDVEVVHEDASLFITRIPSGAAMRYPLGYHPWYPKAAWEGDGVTMLHRPGDWYAPWRFHDGWYLNFQQPYRRWDGGYDTQDLELDIWVPDHGAWQWKDVELLDERVREGRFTAAQAAHVRARADEVAADLDAGRRWWEAAWERWKPAS